MKTLNRILRLFLFLPEEQEKFLSDKLEEMASSQQIIDKKAAHEKV